MQLLANFNILKRFFVRTMMKEYDDELRLFLVSCLKQIDYMEGISDDILTHVALHMVAEPAESGQVIHSEKNFSRRQATTEMKILYKGTIALMTEVDNQSEITVDYVGKGTIFDAHNFLSQRYHSLTVKCISSCVFYYLPYNKILYIAQLYPQLSIALNKAQAQNQADKLLDLNLADYQETNFDAQTKFPGKTFTEKELQIIPDLRLKMKNAVLHWLVTNRARNKNFNTLSKSLDRAVAKYNKRKAKIHEAQKKMKEMDLNWRLNALEADKKRMGQASFEKMKNITDQVAKQDLLDVTRQANQLKGALDQLLAKFETGEHDHELPEIMSARIGDASARASHR